MGTADDIKPKEKPSLGQLLSATRIKRKLSQQDIAEQLNLSRAIINALENDESMANVSSTYVRGYQRAYIRFLELDEDELLGQISSVPQYTPTHENLHVLDSNMSIDGRGSGFRFPFRLVLPLLLVGAGIVYWPQIVLFFAPENIEQTTQATTVESETDEHVTQSLVIQPSTTDNTATIVDVDNAQADSEQNFEQEESVEIELVENDLLTVEKIVEPTILSIDEEENPLDEEKTIEETEIASADSQQIHSKITFIANGESWLEVTDAEDTRLFRNILKLDQITVSGILPLTIRTGNLQALSIKADQGEQRKVDVFDDATTVANFLVEKDEAGRLKFTAL